MVKNVFVLGLDESNRRVLASVRDRERYAFHSLLRPQDLVGAERYRFDDLLRRARDELRRFAGPVDGIATFWDFPAIALSALLCAELGLPSPSARAVAQCSHKLWCRERAREVIPECVPEFQALDPFGDDPLATISLEFPFFIKPVKSYGSFLSFRVESEADLREALRLIRAGIATYSEPFDAFLDVLDHRLSGAGRRSHGCIVEQVIGGHQCTVEGFSHAGEVESYGVIDSLRYPGRGSFARYQYPSRLSGSVRERIAAASAKVIRHLGYDAGAFNIEYFYDRREDRLWLLEINTRISQSHSDLFRKVDGISNHQVILDLALGRRPRMPCGQGRYRLAAKLYLREFRDGTVTAVPSAEQVRRIEARYPDTIVTLGVQAGQRLSELREQEPYSYRLGALYMGASSERELLDNFERCKRELGLRVEVAAGAPETERPLVAQPQRPARGPSVFESEPWPPAAATS